MQATADRVETNRYAKCIEVSKRIRWDIDRDVIRGRKFDFSRKFLPEGLSLVNQLEFLTERERRLLSQVQGRTYANMFGLAERFIGAKILEVSRDHWLGDQTALEALVRFTDEELKHQELFRRIETMIGVGMPATWAFDELKRLSKLDTISEEGSDPEGPNRGMGLKKFVEAENDKNIAQAKTDITNYKQEAEDNSEQFRKDMDKFQEDSEAAMRGQGEKPDKPEPPKLGDAPQPKDAVKQPPDLSSYVYLLHPWGGRLLDALILLGMFFGLLGATRFALRSQDIG